MNDTDYSRQSVANPRGWSLLTPPQAEPAPLRPVCEPNILYRVVFSSTVSILIATFSKSAE